MWVSASGGTDKGGADLFLRMRRNVDLMRQAAGMHPSRLGMSIIIGVAGSGQEIKTRPFQLVTGRV